MTAVADGLPGFRWCKRNEVVCTDLSEKMSLIIALIIRLIWRKKKKKERNRRCARIPRSTQSPVSGAEA